MMLPIVSLYYCLYSLTLLSTTVDAQVGVAFYDVVNAVPFNGSNDTNSDIMCQISQSRDYVLECNPGTKLDDDNIGPTVLNDLGSFFAFSRQSEQSGVLEYTFTDLSMNMKIILHFINDPNRGIGLPSLFIKTLQKSIIPFTYGNNTNLSQTDSGIKSVVLYLQLNMPINFISLNPKFVNTSNIDWFLVSEVDIIHEETLVPVQIHPILFQNVLTPSIISIGPDDLRSDISISCTVTNSGSFEWIWEHNGNPLSPNDGDYRLLIVDATRTNILIINKLRYSHSGNYSCIVNHENSIDIYSKTTTLNLNTGVKVYSDSITSLTAVLVCEGYGYLSETINFRRNGELIVRPVQGKYSLTYKEGEIDSIGSDGNMRGSLIVELEIENIRSSDNGVYGCLSSEVTVLIPISTSSPFETATEEMSSSNINSGKMLSSRNSVLPLALGIAFGVLFLLLITIVIIVALIILVRKKKRNKRVSGKGDKKMEDTTIEMQNTEEVFYCVIRNNKTSDVCLPEKNFNDKTDEQSRNSYTKQHCLSNECVVNGAPNDVVDISCNDNISELTRTSTYSNVPLEITPPISDAIYHEIVLGTNQDKNDEVIGYSKADNFNQTNAMYYQDNAGYDHIRPLSFVLSATYSNGSIYDVPKIVDGDFASIAKIGHENLEEISKLGIGQFGEVLLAKTKGVSFKELGLRDIDDDKNVSIDVAVKKMKLNSDKTLQVAFEKEARFMGQLKHGNVIRLLAINKEGSDPFMVIEYMQNGDLNQFLLQHNISNYHPPNNREELSPQNLLSMAIQVASGMSYLASHNYIHRDLATRNCLVGEDNVIKIADFGLSRSLYDSVYYRVKGKAKMPIRWMATECFYGKFSQFSDVWAYGVTVWEIYTMAREPPYPTFGDLEIIDDALKGELRYLPTKPFTCPKEVYNIIRASCWAADYDKRETFSSIHRQLMDIYAL